MSISNLKATPAHSAGSGGRLSGPELIARLEAMIPALRARGQAAEEAGRIPEETLQELHATDVFRAVVPQRFGGHEIGYRYIPQIFRTLGRGCMSTAWSMGFLVYHNFQFAHFPEAAQQEVWGPGSRGFTMAPGQVMPAGQAIAVEGGYLLTGRWGYATGINHGDWMLFAAPVSGGEHDGDVLRFYAPVKDFTVLDTWNVAAMRATGSHDVTAENMFVPAHRAVKVSELRNARAEGLKNNPGSLYRIPLLTFMCVGGVGPLVGAAEAMAEIVTETLRNKVRAYSIAKAQGQMSTRVRMAELHARLAAMTALYENRAQYVEETVAATGGLSPEDRAALRAVVSWIAKESQELVNAFAREAGSRSIYLDSPVQRFQRDANALATHALFDMDQTGDTWGHILMGQDLPQGAMI
ncbi:MAG: acyl-CoA dehydrogenase family protein [Beijerinckiaceae bacterium]